MSTRLSRTVTAVVPDPVRVLLVDDDALMRAGLAAVLSSDDGVLVVGEAADGASGFLLKRASPEELLAAIKAVAKGDSLRSPSVTRRVLDRMAALPSVEAVFDDRLRALTPREREVLEQVARGLSNVEVAAELVIEESTVKTHVKRILMKLGLRDRVQAVIFAYESGLARPGSG